MQARLSWPRLVQIDCFSLRDQVMMDIIVNGVVEVIICITVCVWVL